MISGAIVIAVALGVASAPSAAAQPTFTFISGYAANTVHATYRGLASQQAVPAVAAPRSNVSVDVKESPESVSIAFHGLQGRSASSESRGMVTVSRSTGSRAASALELGSKTLGPAQASAVLNAMDFAERHPSALDTVRENAAAGNYILEIKELGTPYIDVSMSYPGGPELGKTSIGCNPRRLFRYDPSNNTVNEMEVSCP